MFYILRSLYFLMYLSVKEMLIFCTQIQNPLLILLNLNL